MSSSNTCPPVSVNSGPEAERFSARTRKAAISPRVTDSSGQKRVFSGGFLLAMPMMVLGIAGVAVLLPEALEARTNPGAWGLAEILYGVASPANNNGSAFAGLSSNIPFFNLTQALAMLVGRFFLIIPVVAIAGSLARKQATLATEGSFPTDSPLFVGLLLAVIAIVAGLTFFPLLSLGPVAEALG
ncbi:MAG: hypothetical protein GEU79_09840 [Acidimicrobiia bacterium]|nr:hypothetical protein [Acidimicrobiia bacterium]